MCAVRTAGVEPDVVIVLDVPDDVAEARIAGRPRPVRARGRRVPRPGARAYRELAPERGWVVVDGDGTPDEVGAALGRGRSPYL